MLSENRIKRLRNEYPRGTRIYLIDIQGDELNRGERGTVFDVDDIGDILVDWDNGSHLNLIPEVDSFRKLTKHEIEQERLLNEYDNECITYLNNR